MVYVVEVEKGKVLNIPAVGLKTQHIRVFIQWFNFETYRLQPCFKIKALIFELHSAFLESGFETRIFGLGLRKKILRFIHGRNSGIESLTFPVIENSRARHRR